MEIVKIAVSFATPVILLLLGIWAKRLATEHSRRITLSDRLIAKRLEMYESIGGDLNDIYTYLVQVGQWKEFTPGDIIAKKRKVDRIMYVNRPYWSEATFTGYMHFMQSCFKAWNKIGTDAKIRMVSVPYRVLDSWKDDWEEYFVAHEEVDLSSAGKAYTELLAGISRDFGLSD